jgi:ABC-type transport system involved in multi-copper enzyme maturation permease subunit
MAGMILLSLTSFPSFLANAPPNSVSTSQVFAYDDSAGYHFVAFAWNRYGQPVSGTGFDVSVDSPPSQREVAGSGVTNSSGLTQFTIAASEIDGYTLNLTVSSPNSPVLSRGPYAAFSNNSPEGLPIPLFKETRSLPPATPTTVTDPDNTSVRAVLVSWVGFDGASPRGDKVYYQVVNTGSTCQADAFVENCHYGSGGAIVPSELNQTNSQLLGTMSSYVQVFQAPQLEGNASYVSAAEVAVGLAYPNGTSIAGSVSSIPATQLYPGLGLALEKTQDNQVAVSFFDDIFGLFIPLLAIVTTYNTYGKDRISGVLESVLAQPVTRGGLSLSRFLSSFAGMSVAVVTSVAVLELIAQHFSQGFVDPSIVAYSTVALLVELAAFIGIMMLLSHLVRSTGALIGIGVGLFLVIDFFQGLIVSLLTSVLGIQEGSSEFFKFSVGMEFVNPAQYVSLVDTYLTRMVRTAIVGIPTGSFPIAQGSFGLTVTTISITGVLWTVVPLVCFLYLAIKRD